MHAQSFSRASSGLSSVPDMVQSPSLTKPSASSRETITDTKAMTKLSKELIKKINRVAQLDRNAVNEARKKAINPSVSSLLNPEQQEEAMREAALAKLKSRKANGRSLCYLYPEFEGYIPPAVYGESARNDGDKVIRMEKQVTKLLRGNCGSSGKGSYETYDDEDDEELPPVKKQEGRDALRLEDIAPYDAQQRGKSYSQGKNTEASDEEEDSKDQDGGDEGSDSDSSPEPMVAIIRGQPLPHSETLATPMPFAYVVNLRRQQLVKGIGRAVIRGQVFNTEDEDENEDEDEDDGDKIRVATKRKSDAREGVAERKAKKAKVGK